MKASGGTEFIPGITINNVPFGVLPDDGLITQLECFKVRAAQTGG